MYFLGFLASSLLLAIPTSGVSLLVFFIVKNWFDSKAMSSLLGAAAIAMREESHQQRFHVNRAAIRKVFSRFSDSSPHVMKIGNGVATIYCGLVRHPMINNNKLFSVRFVYLRGFGLRNNVIVSAASGFDLFVLSIGERDFSNSLLQLETTNRISYVSPKDHKEIEDLVSQMARHAPIQCTFPKFRYRDISNFSDRGCNWAEWFSDYRGMCFSTDIGEFEYVVNVRTLDTSMKSDSGIILSVTSGGPNEERRR